MGFAVIHMIKIGKGGLRGIQSHNQREKEPRSNPDIDKSRSKDNYDLIGSGNKNYTQEVNQRIEHFASKTKTVRKDAVVLCNFIITSDEQTMKALSPSQQKGYFEDAVTFLSQRYGSEMIVNATVHMDETTPHLHVGIVPITDDGRLSAKSIFTRSELQGLQTDFAKEVGSKYGLERGVEGSERTHLSEQRFKATKATERLKSVEKEIEAKKDSLIPLQAEYEAKKAFVKQIGKLSRDTSLYPEEVKVSKKLFGEEEIVTVPKEMWEKTRKLAIANVGINRSIDTLDKNLEEFYNSASMERIEDLELEVKDLRQELRNKEVQLHREKNTSKETLAKINQVLQSIPADAAEEFQKAWNAPGHNRGRDR